MTATWHIGDTRTVLRTLPDASVDLVLTSPPFLALRSYLPADDPNKPLEMGSEATPGEFLDALLDVVVECRRVLAPHGSLCIELGDTYAGSGGAGGDYGEGGMRDGQQTFKQRTGWHRAGKEDPERYRSGGAIDSGSPNGGDGWALPKSLCLIPESFRFALAYGRNPFTGRTIEPWRVRNVVRWCRPNPPVGALADKFRPATSEMVIACTRRQRYFDLDAVRVPSQDDGYERNTNGPRALDAAEGARRREYETRTLNPAGAPPLDWWRIPTQPYRGSHYATWPEDLCITPILAMCPQKVCTVCGKASERRIEHLGRERFKNPPTPDDFAYAMKKAMGLAELDKKQVAESLGVTPRMVDFYLDSPPGSGRLPSIEQWLLLEAIMPFDGDIRDDMTLIPAEYETFDRGLRDIPGRLGARLNPNDPPKMVATGWTDCGHDAWRPGIVLDPFAGSGTTLAVAVGHGRHAIGIDLDERNYHLARERIGMFLQLAEVAA